MAKIYTSKDLHGLTGDNGEQYCVFFKNSNNPLASEWAWFHTIADAQEALK